MRWIFRTKGQVQSTTSLPFNASNDDRLTIFDVVHAGHGADALLLQPLDDLRIVDDGAKGHGIYAAVRQLEGFVHGPGNPKAEAR